MFFVRNELHLFRKGRDSKTFMKGKLYPMGDLKGVENTGLGVTRKEIVKRLEESGSILGLTPCDIHNTLKTLLFRK